MINSWGSITSIIDFTLEYVLNILNLPVEENKIKDVARIQEMNLDIDVLANGIRAIPSSTVRKIPSGQWNAETPYLNVNVPSQTFKAYTHLSITNMPLFSTKKFMITGIYGDVSGNWYDLPIIREHDFDTINKIKYINYTSTQYVKLFIGSLYGAPGFLYNIEANNIAL